MDYFSFLLIMLTCSSLSCLPFPCLNVLNLGPTWALFLDCMSCLLVISGHRKDDVDISWLFSRFLHLAWRVVALLLVMLS